jgi:hypothetical protein
MIELTVAPPPPPTIPPSTLCRCGHTADGHKHTRHAIVAFCLRRWCLCSEFETPLLTIPPLVGESYGASVLQNFAKKMNEEYERAMMFNMSL